MDHFSSSAELEMDQFFSGARITFFLTIALTRNRHVVFDWYKVSVCHISSAVPLKGETICGIMADRDKISIQDGSLGWSGFRLPNTELLLQKLTILLFTVMICCGSLIIL